MQGGTDGVCGELDLGAPPGRLRGARSYRAFTSARSFGARIVSTTFASVSPRKAEGFGT